MDRIKLTLPIIVEGRYDKSTLSGFVDAVIITTDGFGVFNNKEKQALIRRICSDGVIVLTDSDGGGKQIRSFLSGIIPADKLHNLYIPKIEGKERRKTHRSAAGVLGVEGMSREVHERLLAPFAANVDTPRRSEKQITKTDFYCDGLSGADCAGERRAALATLAGLPEDMTANALLEAMNLLYGYEGYKELLSRLDENGAAAL